MLSRIGRFVAAALGGEADESEQTSDGETESTGGFAGSILDWSVNYGHGTAGNVEATREMAQIQEKAELLDEADDHRR